jgi:16S rRNA (cytosine967-C5)-methyltransferase
MQKVYRPLCEGVIQNLIEIFNHQKTANYVVDKSLKNNKKWGSKDRKFVANATYEIVRNWRYIKFCASIDERKIKQSAQYWQILGAWLVMSENDLPEWEEFSTIDVPSILTLKEKEVEFKVKYSITDWLNDYGTAQVGDNWQSEMVEMSNEADVYLRVNTSKISVEDCAFRLNEEGIEVEMVEGAEQALKLVERKRLDNTGVFKKGMIEVQDAGSQLIASLLRPRSGEKVIDACAGAGGKTLNLADWMRNKGEIVAMDVDEKKLSELTARAKRNKFDIIKTEIVKNETLSKYGSWADKLLLDVPCSGSGTFRRNVDAKWKLKGDFMENITELQATILQDYTKMLKSGGLLVYATCSIFRSENQEQVQKFLTVNSNFKLVKDMQILPSVQGWDGFYMALLKKK